MPIFAYFWKGGVAKDGSKTERNKRKLEKDRGTRTKRIRGYGKIGGCNSRCYGLIVGGG